MARSRMIGAKAHVGRLRKLAGPDMARYVGKALFAAGELIQVEAQISITAGAVSGKKHVASKPGDAPNADTHLLANNIETVQKELLLVEVSSNAPYAAPLEFGTSKMAARPYMGPARDAKRKEAEQLVKQAVATAVRHSRTRD
ncbi:HK97 gp10 family phage protein [Sphingobium sp. AN558]|uniref:HK97 gp10 family phage protein n=1 Tax=Sphingobium sp. AN558 TaxID=3133442 RepID=UPI0030C19339